MTYYVQAKKFRSDWYTVGTHEGTKSEALKAFDHLFDLVDKLRAVTYEKALADYQAGRAGRPEPK